MLAHLALFNCIVYVQVLNIQTAALEKQKEELQRLRIEEGELLVSYTLCIMYFHSDM